MSQNPLIPAKPAEITLDTLPQLFAHHRARFGGWSMSQTPPEPNGQQGSQQQGGNEPGSGQPQRPDGISEDEWNALGDPGRGALVREREARQAAERALAASRARPTPPKQDPPKPDPGKQDPPGQQPKTTNTGEIDVAAIVQQAVEAAIKPFQERESQRDAEAAAGRVQTAVLDAAKTRLHDATDALAGIDLTTVINDQGQADPAKIKTALDDLITRKPHLAKPQERIAPPGIGGGAPANQTDAEKVKAALADMQRATGVRIPTPTSSTN